MKISLNEIKKYVDVPKEMPTEELVRLIGSRLVEVEGTENLSEKYRGIYVVKVAECEKIPDTHLSLCQIDFGKDELVQVVCGAPNVHKGMLAAWIAPGAIVPETFGGENFRLSVRKLRGHESNGMLAAADELALGEDHAGIIEIDPKIAKPGDEFAEVFGLNDVILDIENKSLTHRPDCFGIIGFAREVAGILGKPFQTPSDAGFSVEKGNPKKSKDGVEVSVEIESSEICEKYCCAVVEMSDATKKNQYFTPDDVFLAKAGMRGISKIVDVTNILMLLTGQPLHAFDYDKFVEVGGTKTAKVGVRLAKNGEELQLLDGKTIQCDENDILITSNDVPVALAGAMGGASTEIDASTKRVLLESATFSLYHLRKTQMKHGIFSEAITRFTKGQPAGNAPLVLASAVELLAKDDVPVVSAILEGGDDTAKDAMQKLLSTAVMPAGETKTNSPIELTVGQINGLLGTDYDTDKCVNTLKNVGFEVAANGEELKVVAPYWRTDIHIKEDLIEEVGRLNGFDNIPKTLAMRSFVGAKLDPLFSLKSRLRRILAERLRAHEVLTYSFVSQDLQEKVLEDPEKSYKIVNSISPELQRFRQSIVPSLLEKTYENLKAGYKDFALFEMNQVSNKDLGLDADGVPMMQNHLAGVTVGDYYQAKNLLEAMLKELHLAGKVVALTEDDNPPKYFEPLRTAKIVIRSVGGESLYIGYVGEIKARVRRALKLDMVAAFELSLDQLLSGGEGRSRSIRVSKFPTVGRDMTVQVASEVEYATVKRVIQETLASNSDLVYAVKGASIYQKLAGVKNLSFHLQFSNVAKTLTAEEIQKIMHEIEENLNFVKGKVI